MRKAVSAILFVSAALIGAHPTIAQTPGPFGPDVTVPESSTEHPGDAGVRVHTNLLILTPRMGNIGFMGGNGPGGGMTPTQLKAFYNMPANGGKHVIAIVDAFDYPNALSDFNFFSNFFGLPTETSKNATSSSNRHFQVVYASGSQPSGDPGWALEMALDIEWAHAMAPKAKIVLVEAASNSYSDLLTAVDVASGLKNVREVSMSWGSGEFSQETSFDMHFPPKSRVVYFASSGDGGAGVIYPSASPNVIAVGGTSVYTDGSGNFTDEVGWGGSGGGTSTVEPRPYYQDGLTGLVGKSRGTPDISADADPNTGVSVYDTYDVGGWIVLGGTSVSSPCVAGMTNLAHHFLKGTDKEHLAIYGGMGSPSFRDIISGSNGYDCLVGWDFVTGAGTPQGTLIL